MEVRNRKDGSVITEYEFRQLFKADGAITIPVLSKEYINDRDYDIVLEGPQATGGTVYQYSMRQGVQEIDGVWYTKYVLGPIFTDGETTAAEQEAAYHAMKDAEQAKSVRKQRNEKLKDCDWTQISDSTADKQAWVTYRQALRDLTRESGFPWTMTWPTAPGV